MLRNLAWQEIRCLLEISLPLPEYTFRLFKFDRFSSDGDLHVYLFFFFLRNFWTILLRCVWNYFIGNVINNRTIEILFRKFRGSTRRYKRFYHCIYLFFWDALLRINLDRIFEMSIGELLVSLLWKVCILHMLCIFYVMIHISWTPAGDRDDFNQLGARA